MKTPTRLAAVTLLISATLTGCAQAVALEPAANAVDAVCADIVVHVPKTLGDLEYRETNAQGTAAWGTPTSVILRCGVAEPDPTSTLQCINVDGIDWLRDDTQDPSFVFTTYGRSPATEVIIDSEKASALAALTSLRPSLSVAEETGKCTNPEDALGTESAP